MYTAVDNYNMYVATYMYTYETVQLSYNYLSDMHMHS